MSGSCSCGRFERSPLGSVLPETWKVSLAIALSMWLATFLVNVGSTESITSLPS